MVIEAADGGVPYYPDLVGKVAVVTGGSRGIGAATCRALASNQVRVAVNGRDRGASSAVVAQSPMPAVSRSRCPVTSPTCPSWPA